MAFYQEPPSPGENPWAGDRVLRSLLARVLPPDVRREVEPSLEEMARIAAGPLAALQREERLAEPTLTRWDPWGRRIDRIDLTPLWREARRIAATFGLVAIPYERRHGRFSRLHQFALAHLFHPASDVYTCPLAMTDGAAKTLLVHENRELVDRAVPRLTARDPEVAWTSGQWMTERTGGSDVGRSETVARREAGGWRLWGTKWFTSAATSEMALTLARPEGNGPGGKGLALFYVETRDEQGALNGIAIHRLKEKLGTRKLPTAEIELAGTVAHPVAGLSDGVRNIAPMLNVTRIWNAVIAASEMRRAVDLCIDWGRKRIAFGAPLERKPLHVETVASLAAEAEAAFHLAFFAVELLGREEAGEASERDRLLLRLVTPLAKLCTGKQVVAVASEALEVFGGAGYVEDTGLPRLLRDGQVLPIWEGTTNVLSLDVLRVLEKHDALAAFVTAVAELCGTVRDPGLAAPAAQALAAVERAVGWFGAGPDEAGARHLAMTLARSLALALLVRHAQWSLEVEKDGRAAAAARQFARLGVDRLAPLDRADAALLAGAPPAAARSAAASRAAAEPFEASFAGAD